MDARIEVKTRNLRYLRELRTNNNSILLISFYFAQIPLVCRLTVSHFSLYPIPHPIFTMAISIADIAQRTIVLTSIGLTVRPISIPP